MDCNNEVKDKIKGSYQSLMWALLTFLELSFPHKKGDNSENEQRFTIIRQKILRLGNDEIRNLDLLMDSIVCLKKYELQRVINQNLETQVIEFNNKVRNLKTDQKGED